MLVKVSDRSLAGQGGKTAAARTRSGDCLELLRVGRPAPDTPEAALPGKSRRGF